LRDERAEGWRFVGAALCGQVRGRRISSVSLWDCLPRRETLKRLEFFVSFCFKTKRKEEYKIIYCCVIPPGSFQSELNILLGFL
jgi:hypothetical protein